MVNLFAALDVLRKGKSLSNPALWKKGGVTGEMVGTFLMVAFVFFRDDLHVSMPFNLTDAQALAVGGVIVGLVNLYLAFATTDKMGVVGLAPHQPDEPGNQLPTPVPAPAPVGERGGYIHLPDNYDLDADGRPKFAAPAPQPVPSVSGATVQEAKRNPLNDCAPPGES